MEQRSIWAMDAIKFFGKFCFTVETPPNEYILTQVGTSHVIVNKNDHF